MYTLKYNISSNINIIRALKPDKTAEYGILYFNIYASLIYPMRKGRSLGIVMSETFPKPNKLSAIMGKYSKLCP